MNITLITMVYGRYNELVNGVYKPTNITRGHHLVDVRLLHFAGTSATGRAATLALAFLHGTLGR